MFKVEIETGNDAFYGENLGEELAKHLSDLAKRVADMTAEDFGVMSDERTRFRIVDSNGNRCGFASYRHDED